MPLMTWGPLQFEVHPLNYHELDHVTASEYARKDVIGTSPPREWVGEDDEEIYIRGRVYPIRIGGLSDLDVMDSMRREHSAHNLVRGDGTQLGWFVLLRFVRSHRYIAASGVGQEIQFEGIFTRVPTPRASDYIAGLLDLVT